MCFHQPAPNHGEDGRLLLLLSALHFINLKGLFVVVVVIVVAAVVVVPTGYYTPEGSGQLVNCWKFLMSNEKQCQDKMTLRKLQRRTSVWEKSETKCSVQNQRERPQNMSDTNSCFSSQPPTRFRVTRHVAFIFA